MIVPLPEKGSKKPKVALPLIVPDFGPIVAPEAVTGPTNRVRCLPYAVTLLASACVKRQSMMVDPGPMQSKQPYRHCVSCKIGPVIVGRITKA